MSPDAAARLGVEQHLDVAERFLKVAEGSDDWTGDARAWTIVFEFYAAVHFVRAYIRFKDDSAQLASHDDVRAHFESMPELQKVKRSYDVLKQTSQTVRYYGKLEWTKADLESTRKAARQVRAWAVPKCKPG